jgi:hypothetical protein
LEENMVSFAQRFHTRQLKREADFRERLDLAELRRPLPANACVPPELAVPVKIGVLRPFYLHGKPTEPGEVVEVPEYLARDLVAIGKATRV